MASAQVLTISSSRSSFSEDYHQLRRSSSLNRTWSSLVDSASTAASQGPLAHSSRLTSKPRPIDVVFSNDYVFNASPPSSHGHCFDDEKEYIAQSTSITSGLELDSSGGSRPRRAKPSALATVLALDGLDTSLHDIKPMRQDSSKTLSDIITVEARDRAWPSSSESAPSVSRAKQRLISGASENLRRASDRPSTSGGIRSSSSRVKSLFTRSSSASRRAIDDIKLDPSPLSRTSSKDFGSLSVAASPVRAPSPRIKGGSHGRSKSASSGIVKAHSRPSVRESLTFAPLSRSTTQTPRNEPPSCLSPMSPDTPAGVAESTSASSSTSWLRGRLKPSVSHSNLSQAAPLLSAPRMTPSHSQSSSSSTAADSMVSVSCSSRPTTSSGSSARLRNKASKADIGFIKTINSFVSGGSKVAKVNDSITDEELKSWRKDRNSSGSGGSSGTDIHLSTTPDILKGAFVAAGRESSEKHKDEDVLVIDKLGYLAKKLCSNKRGIPVSNPEAGVGSLSISFDTSIYGAPASAPPHESSRALSPSQDLLESVFAADRYLMTCSSRSPPPLSPTFGVDSSASSGVEAASQLAASISASGHLSHPLSRPPPPVTPAGGLAPRPVRKKQSSTRSVDTIGGGTNTERETRRFISNEAWEQVSLSAKKHRISSPKKEDPQLKQ